jgi:long-chain acyl-CoA synthetase
MYESQLQKDWEYVINDSESKLLIVANEKIYKKTKHFVGKIGVLESILCLDSSEDYLYSYQRWMNLVDKKPSIPKKQVDENEIATIIYTSGTTGNPKGVELSHKNFVTNIKDVQKLWNGKLYKHTTLNILPWAHVFGLTMELYSMYATGSTVAIISDREQIFSSIKQVKPTCLFSVPLFFNKIHDGILKNVSNQSTFKKYLFNYSLKVARERNNQLEFGNQVNILLAIKYLIVDKLVFSKIRDAFGGELEYMASGGAATSIEVLQFFEDIGIPICEGYGLTETSPVISASQISWSKRRLGTCGLPMINLDVRILDPETNEERQYDNDGEICVSGPSVMTGYRNNQAANNEVFFMKDGKRFFRTGDLGRMVEGKFLKITGRIKGKFINLIKILHFYYFHCKNILFYYFIYIQFRTI